MRGSLEHVLERGRWASNASARIYIQDGVAAQVSMRLPEEVRADLEALKQLLYRSASVEAARSAAICA